MKPSTLVDSSFPCGSLNRRLAVGDRVFFLSCPDSLEKEDEAARPKAFVLQSASCLVNRPPLPCIFGDGVVEGTLNTPDTTLDTPIPFLFEWTTPLLGRCSCTLHNTGVYYGLWASLFKDNRDISLVRLFLMLEYQDKHIGHALHEAFHHFDGYGSDLRLAYLLVGASNDEVSPMVADFTDVRSSDLPYSCRCLFLAYHHLCRSSESNVISTAAWVEFWFWTEDSVVPVSDPWTAWYARYGKGSCALEGTEVVGDLVEIPPSSTQLEVLQEAAPLVVQEEATTEEEAPTPVLQEAEAAPAPSTEEVVGIEAPIHEAILVLEIQEEASIVQEEAPTSAVKAPAIEEVVEIVQEEVPAAVAEVAEVVPAVEEVTEVVPAVEEVPIVQNMTTSLTLPTLPASTSLATPSQQLLSHVEGTMLQGWKDIITPRMLSTNAVRDTSLAADADFIIGKLQEAESDAREALDALSSKLENAEITLDEASEDLSEAKADEEDARERLELAIEQLQSIETKVVYLTTQVEQIRESVQDLKKAVVGAEQKVAEVIARPTLSASEEAALLSLRADFAELQQEMRDL
ncbi:hypothetical protein H6P81_012823 [Aristolochia fimbriata]|uniref:Uncharacterized protein n=1 Tax=Aristolochia fimbriata TaxID=158543 RepID=A0AAV7EF30_ARIFI|nr:hypothetical protein H6P81_012823 [Aristolochia fimbriata]